MVSEGKDLLNDALIIQSPNDLSKSIDGLAKEADPFIENNIDQDLAISHDLIDLSDTNDETTSMNQEHSIHDNDVNPLIFQELLSLNPFSKHEGDEIRKFHFPAPPSIPPDGGHESEEIDSKGSYENNLLNEKVKLNANPSSLKLTKRFSKWFSGKSMIKEH